MTKYRKLQIYLLDEYDKYLDWIKENEGLYQRSDVWSLAVAYSFYLFFMTMPEFVDGMIELILDADSTNIYMRIVERYWENHHMFDYLNDDKCYIFLKNMARE